jgi:tRNA(fMet)-specific endonuclease VapC
MTGSSIALDTNQAVHVLNDVAEVISWLNGFGELCLPVTVVGELRFGALKSTRAQANLERVEALAARCTLLDARLSTADFYARSRFDLLRKGRPIPENDIWIAAACLQHNVPLATDDRHFDEVPGLRVVRRP